MRDDGHPAKGTDSDVALAEDFGEGFAWTEDDLIKKEHKEPEPLEETPPPKPPQSPRAKPKRPKIVSTKKPSNGSNGSDDEESALVADKRYVNYDRLLEKAQAEGRIDGQFKCLTCGMKYNHKEEAEECCRVW